LTFARREELKVTAVDIPSLVAGMADLLTRSIDSKVDLERRFPLKVAPVLADANQLELALLNLVVNARDAMPDGGTIVISAKEANAQDGGLPGRFVCLSVTDSGEGMDEETLARATEPFFTTKGVGKGTGLGLPMIQSVAHQAGGRLVLKSQKGQGTSAELWLPCAANVAAKADAVPLRAPDRSLRPRVVLLVDDDSLVRNSATAMLEDLGHRVFPAASAEEALSLLAQRPEVQLLITDHAMPKMTGAELVEVVRQRYAGLPVILATGRAELPTDYAVTVPRLAKPFTQGQMEDAIAHASGPAQ